MMPASGTETRGRQIAAVAEAARAQLLSDETARLVDQAEAEQQGQPADSPARDMILQAQEAIAFHRCIGDAPAAWNSAMEASLGVKVPDDRRGILQDPHWLWGQFGGFCSYTIGNVMAAQLYQAATAHCEGIGDALSRGEYEPLKSWLFENIHRHGRRYTRNDLLLKATGRPLDPEPYIAYLRSKYRDLYDLPMS